MDITIIASISFYLLRVSAASAVLLFGRYLAGRFCDMTKEALHRPEVGEALGASVESILVRQIQLLSSVLMHPEHSLAVLPNGDLQKDGMMRRNSFANLTF